MAPKNKDPREYLIKSKLYRVASYFFVAVGIFVFGVFYVKNIEGRLFDALRDPATISLFIIPFVPAVALTFLADRAEKKYRALIEKK
ncbi:MAG: hypothetical protein WC043_05015 [Pseudobdellovibrionaceae bacterium]